MEKSKIRKPVVAGQFYPASAGGINKQIEAFINAAIASPEEADKKTGKLDVIGCMLPHAGYMYSGGVAAATVSGINIKDKIILLGPNHTGDGAPFSIMTEGIWQMPSGDIEIDSALAKQILSSSKSLQDDNLAHRYEHSLEVELPFLQYFKTDFKIVPVAILSDQIDILKEIGRDIAGAIKDSNLKDSTLIVASSDMTHYESQDQAVRKDKEAIEAILGLNEDKLMQTIRKLNISMCGYAPVVAMLSAAKVLGAKSGKLIKYQTSGDVTGDKSSVVGYAGIVIY